MHQSQGTLFGLKVVSDDRRLVELVNMMTDDPSAGLAEQLDKLYPSLRGTIGTLVGEIERTRKTCEIIIYRNAHVQVWPSAQFDGPPSQAVRSPAVDWLFKQP